MRRWCNHTNLPDGDLRRLYRTIRPTGLPAHDCLIVDCLTGIGFGAAFHQGPQRVVVGVPRTEKAARVQWPLFRSRGRLETYVFILAHELRHLWQARHGHPQSEHDANQFAWRTLARYRKDSSEEPR